ncbi:MAG: polysaccharide export protein [Octadecabacter sp.]|nr:polysaccharide export protein [Octadecabacter sp.]
MKSKKVGDRVHIFDLKKWPIVAACALSGCALLPSDGPRTQAVIDAGIETVPAFPEEPVDTLPYNIERLSHSNIAHVSRAPYDGLREQFSFPGSGGGRATIAVGDTLEMTLWEDIEVSLLSTTGQRATDVQVLVDESGRIELPYVGQMQAAGRSPSELRATLEALYSAQTIRPEVTLSIVASEARTATVLGDVHQGGRIDLPLQGISLLELVASAGGPSGSPWEINLQVLRGTHRQTVRMRDVLDQARNNIRVQPGDIVHVLHDPRRFTVMGAVNSPGAVEVATPDVSLLDILSAAGGLQTDRSDPNAIFVYRDDPAANGLPTVYLLDLEEADSLFLASRFRVSREDIVYVGTADIIIMTKFFDLIFSPVTGLFIPQ